VEDELFSVKGKRIFITGGASGIGKMMIVGLCERGARIFTCSRKQSALDELLVELKDKRGFDIRAEQADLSKLADVDRAAHLAGEHFGGEIDVLVNNAGAAWGADLDEFPEVGWDKVFDLNVKALFFLTQKCLPYLRRAGSSPHGLSRVINIGSIAGMMCPPDNGWSYHPAKAAVHHLTETLAKRLVHERIAVNAIAPGVFPSKMTAHSMPGGDDTAMSQLIPMGRVGRASDIVGAIVYLASAASAFTTGTILKVDGGSAL
jgi:NAD(P)-dependent dehydrogenase (short-subunit alcohol dehydrogenase family)